MTPTEALQILEQASGEYRGSRKEHLQIQQALIVLSRVVNPTPDVPSADSEEDTQSKEPEGDKDPKATEEPAEEPGDKPDEPPATS